MISKEDFIVIKALYKKGYSVRKIALITKLNRRTVTKRLKEEELKPSSRTVTKVSKLEAYKPYILKLISNSNKRLSSFAILDEIRELGYQGGKSILQEFLALEYRNRQLVNDPVVRFETKPGEQAQADWTTLRSGRNPIHALVVTLGYSRMSFVWFTNEMSVVNLLDGLEQSFAYFTGVPQTLLFDNMKAVVEQRNQYGEGLHKFNNSLFDFSKCYGFTIKLCKPYRAKTKGKVERFNSYLKSNFYRTLVAKLKNTPIEINVDLLNSYIYPWLDKANKRIHGTTGKAPVEMLANEAAYLLPFIKANLTPAEGPQVEMIRINTIIDELSAIQIIQPQLSTYEQLLSGAAQ